MEMTKILTILFILISIQSFANETCNSLFTELPSGEVVAKISSILLDLYALRSTALNSQDSKATLISKIEFEKKLSELERYLPLETIRKRLTDISNQQKISTVVKKTEVEPLLPEIDRLITPPKLKSSRIVTDELFDYSADQGFGLFLTKNKNEAIIEEINSGKKIFSTLTFQNDVYRAGFTKKANIIYTTNFEGELTFYDISKGSRTSVPQRILGFDAIFSTNNEYMITNSRGDSYLYHLVNNQYELVSTFNKSFDKSSTANTQEYFYGNGRGAIFTPDEQNVIALDATGKNTLRVIEYSLSKKTIRVIVKKTVAKEKGIDLSISNDGKSLVIGSTHGMDTWVRKYDVQTGKKIFSHKELGFNYVPSSDHQYMYIISKFSNLQIYDMITGEIVHDVKEEFPTYSNAMYLKGPGQVIISGPSVDASTGISYLKIWEW
jgi:WD40 repeat protein